MMSEPVQLHVGDKYDVAIGTDQAYTLEIIGLTALTITYLIDGANVKNPNEPRERPIYMFIQWLERVGATKAGEL